ncbi:MAG: hypothetical protein J2P54_05265 [Bradyrhizobiaceae bacterium]|nr:hypothetical protein [Bradyrhizobiaceae bacterium]
MASPLIHFSLFSYESWAYIRYVEKSRLLVENDNAMTKKEALIKDSDDGSVALMRKKVGAGPCVTELLQSGVHPNFVMSGNEQNSNRTLPQV